MTTPDTPLFIKTHDFLLWLIRHTQRFPKNLRHTYTQRLENIALEFQEAVLMGEIKGVRGRFSQLSPTVALPGTNRVSPIRASEGIPTHFLPVDTRMGIAMRSVGSRLTRDDMATIAGFDLHQVNP